MSKKISTPPASNSESPQTGSQDQELSLASFTRQLEAVAPPQRSRLAHVQTWEHIESHINQQRSVNRWRIWRWASLAAAAVVVAGVFFVSQSALPGDPTYAIKRQIEDLQVSVSQSDARKAEACSMQMKRRANELARLSDSRLQTSNVSELSASILNEAREYNDYIASTAVGMDRLVFQRQRDIDYVTAALRYTLDHTKDAEQQHILRQTIGTLDKNG